MKLIISIILIILLSFCACLYFPWWSIAIVAFIIAALIPQKPGVSFVAGFVALFLLWGGLSFWINSNNDGILAKRVSLLIFKSESPLLLIFITALIGALIGGFAALTASYIRPVKTTEPKQLS
jgi:hypothetical protein